MSTWNNRTLQDSACPEAVLVESSQEADEQRHQFVASFERWLFHAWLYAVAIGALDALSHWLAFLLLYYGLWLLIRSSAVLSFTSENPILAGISGFAVAISYMRLFRNPFASRSRAMQQIKHKNDVYHYVSGRDRILSRGSLLALNILSFIFQKHTLTYLGSRLHDPGPSLVYNFLTINSSIVASVDLILFCLAFASLYENPAQKKHPEQSILRYFDTVFKNARTLGLVAAGNFDVFRFAYTLLGHEICRISQPEVVATNHKNLIRYLYYHRLGVNYQLIFMEEEDRYVQLAAVTMVGWWADSPGRVGLQESELNLPKVLLRKLADKVDTGGQLGGAAICSVEALSGMPRWAKKLLKTRNIHGQLLPDCLVDRIDVSSVRSLSILRTLVHLYEQGSRRDQNKPSWISTDESYSKLREKLSYLAKTASVHRIRVQAAHLLLLMQAEPPTLARQSPS